MSNSCSSSLSSDEDDEFACFRTGNVQDVESSVRRKPRAASIGKTPAMKTPSMDALTRKYEFLLAQDDNQDLTNDGNAGGGTSYFQTPILSSSKIDRTRSQGSRQSSRNSSRSTTPTRRPVLTAQKILHRLQSGDIEDSEPTEPRTLSASPSWEAAQGRKRGYHEDRYRTQLKQNLEQRLQHLENQSPITKTPPRPGHNQRQQPRSTPTRRSPYRRNEPNYSKERKNPPVQSLLSLPNAPPSPSDYRFAVASSTTTTTTTMALTEAPSPAARAKTHHRTLPIEKDHSEQQQDDKLGIVPWVESSPSYENNPRDDEQLHPSPPLDYKESNSNSNISYWHRWKMAERRLRQQQEEFDQEKEEWMRQLESAQSTNAKVEALVKRYDVQLRAVHKTCLQQDGVGFGNDDDDEIIHPPEEEPLDPLQLLLLKENGTDVDAVQWTDSEDSEGDKETRNCKLKRRMERTKTKNVILSHLVRLLERQAEEQKKELEQQLKEEKEEKDELWAEFQKLQVNGEGQVLAPHKSSENKVMSPLPTGDDQVKALRHRLWLREQQYAQERKEFETKVQTLQAECDSYKKNQQQVKSPTQTSEESENNAITGQLEVLQKQKAAVQARCDALQKECDQYQQQATDAERSQKFKELQQSQERSQLERQLAKAQDDLRGLSQAQEKVKAMEEKLEQTEAKHNRERKEWEAKLLQQGKRLAASAAGNTSVVTKELHEKQRKRWEAQLEAAQQESELNKKEAEECRERETRLVEEKEDLARNLSDLKIQLERYEKERDEQESVRLEEHNLKILKLQQKFSEDQQEYKDQLDMLRVQRDEKWQQVEQLQSQMDETDAELTKLQRQLSEAEAAQVVATGLEEKIAELEACLHDERESAQNAWEEVSRYREEITHLKEEHAKDSQLTQGILEEKYEDLEYELQKCKDDLDKCMATVESESKKCNQITKLNVELERELGQLRRRHSEEKDEWDIIVDSLNAEKDAVLLGSEKHQELLIRAEKLEKQLNETNADLEKTVKSLKVEENRNHFLDQELMQLNERFVQEMKQLEGSYNSQGAQANTLELETKIENLHKELEEERRKCQETCKEKESPQSERQQLAEESKTSKRDSEALEMEVSTSQRDLLEKNAELEEQLEEARKELRATIESLNAEVGDSGNHDRELQRLNDDFAREKQEWEEQLSSLQGESHRTLQELNEKNDALEAEVRELQTSLDVANRHLEMESEKHRRVNEKSLELELELDEANKVFAEEKTILEYEIQQQSEEKTTLEYEIQRQSAEMYELAEAKVELEQLLEETKSEVESCRKSWQLDSERCQELVEKVSFLETEIKQIRGEKKNWEYDLQATEDRSNKNEEILRNKNTQLEREIETIKSIYEKAIQDWRRASEQSNEEISKMQKQQDELVQEKHSLQIQLSAAERQIEVIQSDLHARKREPQNHPPLLTQKTVDSCTDAVEELRREVMKISDHVAVSNETAKELTNKNISSSELLAALEIIQTEMTEAARKLSSETQATGESREADKSHLHRAEVVSVFTLPEKDIFLDHQKSILEQIKEMRLQINETAGLHEIYAKQQQYETDLARVKDLLERATNDLAVEKEKRASAENEAAMLGDQLSVYNDEVMRLQTLSVQYEGVPLDAAAQGHRKDEDESLSSSGVPTLAFDFDLDRQLDDLNNQINREMEEVRSLCRQKATDVEPYEEPTEAREAMVAQSFLLVQSIRGLMVDETDDQEEGATNVMQHLEVLSELMAEVDRENRGLSSAAIPPGNNNDKLVEVRMEHERAEGILMPPNAQTEKEETDLLRYELAQDDSMLDLLNDESPEQGTKPTYGEFDDSAVGIGTTSENYYGAADGVPSWNNRTETASPIQMMIEQTYNRCQVLERERCDLMNVTLDLLSAAREANKAEIDAAMATARRKASEEMLQMKAATQAQVDQIWFRLCDKCQQTLTNG